MIYKKGDKELIKNWRPITLLNSDYKIYAKLLANRMKQSISSIIEEDQTCAVPGRVITESLLLVRDIIWDVGDRRQRMALTTLDFEKAYDRVSHEFLFSVLKKMGCPEKFVKQIQSLYGEAFSQISVNGFLSEKVSLLSGVKQGCPLSPILFICAIEPLLCAVRRDKVVEGFFVPGSKGKQIKTIAYMDDVTLIIKNSKSLKRALRIVDWFCCGSGFKINLDKSGVFLIGDFYVEPNIQIPVVTEVKILGIWFSGNCSNRKNWVELLERVKKKLDFWRLRRLTMEGKILIVKQVILPIILYVSIIFFPPLMFLKKMIKYCFNFFWGAKMERAKREEIYKPKCKGGKNFPDIKKFLSLKYFSFIINKLLDGESRINDFLKYQLGFFSKKYGWVVHDNTKPIRQMPPENYIQLEKVLREYKLMDTDVEILRSHQKLKKMVEDKIIMSPVKNYSYKVTKGIWEAVSHPALTNEQKDLNWNSVKECLPTRNFQYGRSLVRNPKCVREVCGSDETVMHIFWNCTFAQNLFDEACFMEGQEHISEEETCSCG